ncbi:MAG: methyltransferase domain-containing protein [Proteobacteria bacterium]|nr:methyltransferase domain-containing protein [Pseudomonadota bacterium]
MKPGTMWQMMGGTNVRSVLKALDLMEPVHRAAWLGAAIRHGVLARLAEAPATLDELAESLAPEPSGRAGLRAWLRHGILLKELRLRDGRYHLSGALGRLLADPDNDGLAGYMEALMGLHARGVGGVLDRLKEGETYSVADLDGPLIARTSELLGPVLREEIDRAVSTSGATALLELGCGSGHYLRYACERNPELTAVGVELDFGVADAAASAMEWHELADRARIVAGDLRTVTLDRTFDVVTLFNLLYYFPVEQRRDVIAAAAGHVAPGGQLVLGASCGGGTLANNMLDIWFSSMAECGPLPKPDAVVAALEAAGLSADKPRRALPGESYFVFVGRRS